MASRVGRRHASGTALVAPCSRMVRTDVAAERRGWAIVERCAARMFGRYDHAEPLDPQAVTLTGAFDRAFLAAEVDTYALAIATSTSSRDS